MAFRFNVERFVDNLYSVHTRDPGEFVRYAGAWRCTGYEAACRSGDCAHVRAVKERTSGAAGIKRDNPTAAARPRSILAERPATVPAQEA